MFLLTPLKNELKIRIIAKNNPLILIQQCTCFFKAHVKVVLVIHYSVIIHGKSFLIHCYSHPSRIRSMMTLMWLFVLLSSSSAIPSSFWKRGLCPMISLSLSSVLISLLISSCSFLISFIIGNHLQ